MKMLKYTDKILLLISVFLFAIGLIMIFSSSSISAFMRYNKTSYNLNCQEFMNHCQNGKLINIDKI